MSGATIAVLRQIRTDRRLRCADCGRGIRKGQLMVRHGGKTYHLQCAASVNEAAHKQGTEPVVELTPCPECFILPPCNCGATLTITKEN